MLAIDAAGALDMTTSNFGSAAQPNLFINRLTDLPDTDLPDFNVDSRFWHFWLGNYAASNVSWAESNFGISGRDFVTGDVVQTLANGGFYGFYASAGPVAPRLPIAVPEPAAIILAALGFLLIACARDHKFKTAAHRLTASQTFIRT
jgi:peptidoglycan/LPS O-acetylase OafA/YrhL